MPLQPPLQPTTMQQDEGKIDFEREKSALPKLQIKGGDATNITRTIHEWLQRTSLTLTTWSASAVQLWRNAVAVAKAAHQQWTSMAPSQRALQTGLPSTGHALPAQLSVLEAITRSNLCNHCLPEKIQSLAVQKGAHTVSDLLYLTFQSYLPSEPIAPVEGLATIEAPVKPSKTFGEALSFLRSWRQQVYSVSSTAQVLICDLELLKTKLHHLLQYLNSTKTLGLLYRFPKKRELTEFTLLSSVTHPSHPLASIRNLVSPFTCPFEVLGI